MKHDYVLFCQKFYATYKDQCEHSYQSVTNIKKMSKNKQQTKTKKVV